MEEIFKTISEGNGSYSISNFGRVIGPMGLLKPKKLSNGYLGYNLYINGKHTKRSIHRLVAETFIPNPKKKRTVNHKDGDKKNNCVNNLEWATHSENTKHALRIGLMVNKPRLGKDNHRSKRVYQIDSINSSILNVFNGTREAHRKTGIQSTNIAKVCRGELNHAGGYAWKYES